MGPDDQGKSKIRAINGVGHTKNIPGFTLWAHVPCTAERAIQQHRLQSSMFNNHKALRVAVVAALLTTSDLRAQIPGAPVLQNAFSNDGLAVAANFGSGGQQSLFAVAAGWGLMAGRLQVSGAAGAQRMNDATRGAYGAKAALNVWTSRGGSLGLGAFAGVGAAPRTRAQGVMTNPAVMTVPAGATVAYRRSLGTARGLSAYVSPMYRYTKVTTDAAGSDQNGNMRVSLGVDFSFNPTLGITVGSELGSGDSGSNLLGVAVSWVPGGRR